MSQYPLRIPEHIMSRVRTAANEDGVSINQMMLAFIAEGVGYRDALKSMKARATRADFEAVEGVLALVPDVPAEAHDRVAARK